MKGTRLLRPMVLIIVLVQCSIFTLQAQTKTYKFELKNITLKNAMLQVEKETGYAFFYNNDIVDTQVIVNLHEKKATLDDIVKLLFPNYNYRIENKKIIIISKHISTKIHVSGFVVDSEGVPVVGASVIEKETTNGVMSGLNGEFNIFTSPNSTLIITSIGYISERMNVKRNTYIRIVLKNDLKILNEIMVIGYGIVKKQDLTGSVANVNMTDVEESSVVSVDHALQGRLAGVDIMSTTGEPGAVTSIRIRGTRSISATNEPLIVVDGVIDGVSDISDINPTDIESISVLKDASSTAIYGARGSNGVIIITTRKGKKGKVDIQLKADFGIAQLPRKLDLMNGAEFAQYRNDCDFFINSGHGEIPFPNPSSYGKGTDWVDEVSQTALSQNYTLSISGGADKSNYYASLSFNNTEGIIQNSGLKRYTGRFNIDHYLLPWLQIGARLSYTLKDQDLNVVTLGGTNWWNAAIYLSPLIEPTSDFNSYWYAGQKFNSPRVLIEQNTNIAERHVATNTGYLKFQLLDDLALRTQLTYYKYKRERFQYEPGTLPAKAEEEGGLAYRAEYDVRSVLSENTMSYTHLFNDVHHLDALLGFTAQRWQSSRLTLLGRGYQVDAVKWNDMGAIYNKDNYVASSSIAEKRKMSVISRFNYNYRDRYYVTFTGRSDAASNFAKYRKWGFFPSGALKWNIYNEAFMQDYKWMDEVALRLSAGRTGNDGIAAYQSLEALNFVSDGYLFDSKQPVAVYPFRLASENLSWEKTDVYNLALDLSFFKNRVSITTEGYLSYTSDVLLNIPTPTHTGYSSRFANVGKTSNKGFELFIETKNLVNRDFTWSTAFTLSHNKQMVNDIGTSDFVKAYSAYGNNSYMMYGYVKDYPLNALWGFKYGGTWKNQEEIDRNNITKAYVSVSNAQKTPGCARYLDINHDGIMNENDLVYLGNADPWLHGGIQNTFNYRNFTFSIYFNYSLGGKIYNISEQWMGNGSPYTNQYSYMTEAWHPTRYPDSDIPRAGSMDAIASDRMVYDASYLRLKNVFISYRLPMSHKCQFIRDIRFSVNGDNLYLWKRYNGFDPDVSSDSNSSILRRVDIGAYPKPRTLTFSVQVSY